MSGFAPIGGAPIGAPLEGGGDSLDVVLTDGIGLTSPVAVGLYGLLVDGIRLVDRVGELYATLSEHVALSSTFGSIQSALLLETVRLDAAFTDLDSVITDGIALVSSLTPAVPHGVSISEAMRLIDDLVAQPGYSVNLSDGVGTASSLLGFYGKVLREAVQLGNQLIGNQLLHLQLADELEAGTTLRVAIPATLLAGLGVHLTSAQQLSIRMAEQLQIAQTLAAQAHYHLSLTSNLIRLHDSLDRFFGAGVLEGLGLSPALAGVAHRPALLTDNIRLTPGVTPQLLLSVVLHADVALAPASVVKMLFHPELADDVEFSAGYLAPDGSLTTWTMNVRTGAVSEYSNYAFNSFARVGNRYLGASEDGLYELLGDSDAGDEIIGRIKSGFMQFGGTHLSRLSAAYIAARGEGDFVLRIETADGTQYNYLASTHNMRSTKVNMGKGQRSRYFAFELISTGQDFDLDTLEFVPVVVNRRV